MGDFIKVLFSSVGGIALLIAVIIFKKRQSTKPLHKTHAVMLGVAGYGLAFATGSIIIGIEALVKLGAVPFSDFLAGWLWAPLGFIATIIRLAPQAVPFVAVIVIPWIVLKELWPGKIWPHVRGNETPHTPWFALFVIGSFAALPMFAHAFDLDLVVKSVS